MNALTREVLVAALRLLAEELRRDEPRVDLIVVGGAAMVLLFGARGKGVRARTLLWPGTPGHADLSRTSFQDVE